MKFLLSLLEPVVWCPVCYFNLGGFLLCLRVCRCLLVYTFRKPDELLHTGELWPSRSPRHLLFQGGGLLPQDQTSQERALLLALSWNRAVFERTDVWSDSQSSFCSRWIVAQQKVAPSAASGGEGSQELRPSYHDEAKGVFGCEHYQRNCKVKAACCGQLVTCRFCHDKDSDHTMDR